MYAYAYVKRESEQFSTFRLFRSMYISNLYFSLSFVLPPEEWPPLRQAAVSVHYRLGAPYACLNAYAKKQFFHVRFHLSKAVFLRNRVF